jgi:hypothetical protein
VCFGRKNRIRESTYDQLGKTLEHLSCIFLSPDEVPCIKITESATRMTDPVEEGRPQRRILGFPVVDMSVVVDVEGGRKWIKAEGWNSKSSWPSD